MAETCKLHQLHGVDDHLCDGETCLYWRVLSHLSEGDAEGGCGIQEYELLGDSRVAAWLLSVKQRIENVTDGGK